MKEEFYKLIKKYPNDSELGAAIRLATLHANGDIKDSHTICKVDSSIANMINFSSAIPYDTRSGLITNAFLGKIEYERYKNNTDPASANFLKIDLETLFYRHRDEIVEVDESIIDELGLGFVNHPVLVYAFIIESKHTPKINLLYGFHMDSCTACTKTLSNEELNTYKSKFIEKHGNK